MQASLNQTKLQMQSPMLREKKKKAKKKKELQHNEVLGKDLS